MQIVKWLIKICFSFEIFSVYCENCGKTLIKIFSKQNPLRFVNESSHVVTKLTDLEVDGDACELLSK